MAREFGLAYDRVRGADHVLFDRFLDRAVAGLAEEGKIAPVRLALFAQMLKDKPWSPATLKDMRGLEGIGVKFLEESLDGPLANPEHRLNAQAARHVLRALLPLGAADIKGHMRSYQELLEASGYARRPGDFDTLLAILGNDLRLITPTDPRGADAGDVLQPDHHTGRRRYRLHALPRPSGARPADPQGPASPPGGRGRDPFWCERTAEWTTRHCAPLLADVAGMDRDRALHSPVAPVRMERAFDRGGYPLSRVARAAVVVAAARPPPPSSPPTDSASSERAPRSARRENAQASNVPKVIQNLASYRRWADPLLRKTIDDNGTDPRRKARARLALLPVDASQASGLFGSLIDGDPDLFLMFRNALCEHGDRGVLAEKCRELLRNEQEAPDRRHRATTAFVGLLGEGPSWQKPS